MDVDDEEGMIMQDKIPTNRTRCESHIGLAVTEARVVWDS
jgi:hypothetical protein